MADEARRSVSEEALGAEWPRMYRVALRLLRDPEAAQEAVQEAYARALGGLGRFNGGSSLATWLHRITVNCATDALRRLDRDGRLTAMMGQAPPRAHPAGPAELAAQRELAEVAMSLLENLPDECRTAFALTQLDGYSYDEAAEIEHQPRGTIASRVWRAKRILIEQMSARSGGRVQA